jgi:uncharacterized protein
VLVAPRSSQCAFAGVHDGRIKVMLDAPPVDGKANDALIAFFAKALGRAKRDVTIVRGLKGRQKTLALRGTSVAEVTLLVTSAARAGQ